MTRVERLCEITDAYKLLVGKFKGRRGPEALWKTKLTRIVRKWGGRMWSGFNWIMTGSTAESN
jgi:hypothetical protein